MKALNRYLRPNASTNTLDASAPACPDIAWSKVLTARERACILSLMGEQSRQIKGNSRRSAYFIISTIRSTPSLFKNESLISASARAEHNESKTFSRNSASSASVGSRRRNCCGMCETFEENSRFASHRGFIQEYFHAVILP